jgi:beta-N-acetylhexosaminidase
MGAIGAVLSACGLGVSTPPSVSPSGSPLPSSTPSPLPSPSATPGPSLRAKIGQMLLVGFRGLDVAQAASTVADIRERNLGGILLFDVDQPTHSAVRNIASASQLRTLVAGLQAVAATPLIVATDEEGGEVARLGPNHGFPATVSAAALGLRNDPAYTQRRGQAIAATLRAVGINLNLAPVVDLNVNPANPIIGALDRSFSADPKIVTAQALAFIAGHRADGVKCTLKHFPGHGSSTGDTHLGVVDVTDTWSRVELTPFADVISAGQADAVLTAHVFNATLDPDHPATLSEPTVTGILRGELGYDGLVISDDMQMGAIRKAYGYTDALRLAILAGVDVLTIANQQVFEAGIVGRTVDIIQGLVTGGQLSEARIDESYRRIMSFKAGLG